MLIGTLGSEIIKCPVDLRDKKVGAMKAITKGHYAPLKKDNNEVWGLACFNSKDLAVSCSDDATLRLWDLNKHEQIHIIRLDLDKNG